MRKIFIYLLKLQIIVNILIFCAQGIKIYGQIVNNNTILLLEDVSDTLKADTSFTEFTDTLKITDTIKIKKSRKSDLEDIVNYNATDSIIISLSAKRMFLYNSVKINYQDINLTADYVEFDLSNNVVMATGVIDTSGVYKGKPEFKQGEQAFVSDTIRYNFKTKKGIIKYIATQEGEGYLQAEKTKRDNYGHIHIKGGKYTTCDASHPHFYIALTKAIAIPDDKIVSGPIYFVLEDIPLPVIIPFGFFPNTKRRSAGILLPTYGEEKTRGFYLRQGGLYLPFSDYADFVVQGDVYSRGTWGISAKSNYVWKYHFRGMFDFRFYKNQVNDDPTFSPSKDYSIQWSHSQDPKANPTQSFSANVNISSHSYDQRFNYNIQDKLSTTKQSSISYSKRWGNLFSMDASFSHSQNNQTQDVYLNLPKVSFRLNTPIYPFRSKELKGKPKLYENIQFRYNASFDNRIKTKDSLLFTKQTLKDMNYGFMHDFPISLVNFRILKIINVVPSVGYRGIIYGNHIEKRVISSNPYSKSLKDSIVTDTINKFHYLHGINTGISFSINQRIYGIFQSKNSKSYIQAVRHVISPSASFSFSPDMSKILPSYSRKLTYARSIETPYSESKYNIFERGIFGVPTPQGKQGSLSLGLGNNIEMKVKSKKDTSNTLKKISILDNFNFSANYSPFKDSMRWSNISMNGSTRLVERLSINFNGVFSPYAINSKGLEYNKSYFRQTGKLVRLTSFNVSTGISFQSAAGKKSEKKNEENKDITGSYEAYAGYVDFDVPWSLNISFSWSYSKPGYVKNISSVINISGDISLTKKWKIGGNTGFDFIRKEITYSNLNIYRDLHCWEMRMSIIPFGRYQSYSFTICAKSSLLRDLKWDKRKSWYDYNY